MSETFIKRARDFHLYDSKGTRYLDLSLCEGAAVLGHKPLKASNAIKQALQYGVWGYLDGRETSRTIRNLNKYIPNWNLCAVFHADLASFCEHPRARALGITRIQESIVEADSGAECKIWRPFSHISRSNLHNTDTTHLITPIAIPWYPPLYALYSRDSQNTVNIESSEVLLAALNHLIPYLVEKGTDIRPHTKIAKNRKDMFRVDLDEQSTGMLHTQSKRLKILPSWQKRGVYIIVPEAHLELLKAECFAHRFFIACKSRFLVLPQYMTQKETENWEAMISKCERG